MTLHVSCMDITSKFQLHATVVFYDTYILFVRLFSFRTTYQFANCLQPRFLFIYIIIQAL